MLLLKLESLSPADLRSRTANRRRQAAPAVLSAPGRTCERRRRLARRSSGHVWSRGGDRRAVAVFRYRQRRPGRPTSQVVRIPKWSEFQEVTAEYEVSLILRDHRSDPKTSVERTSARVVRIRRRVEPIDLIDGIKIVVERIEVVESLGVHVRDDAHVDER